MQTFDDTAELQLCPASNVTSPAQSAPAEAVLLVESATSHQPRQPPFQGQNLKVFYQDKALEVCTVLQSQVKANMSKLFAHNNSMVVEIILPGGCVGAGGTGLSDQVEF